MDLCPATAKDCARPTWPDDVTEAPSKATARPSTPSVRRRDRLGARRAADRFRQGHAERPLSAARRNPIRICSSASPRPMPTTPSTPSGSTTISRSCGSCRRRPVLSNGGTGRGLPISCYLNWVADSLEGIVGTWNENVWLAARGGGIGTYWGTCPRHRRAGRPQRQDQRHHPVRPGDGLPDAGDQPGLAAARLGRLLSRHLAPRDRGVPRDPQALGRLQPQGAQPPPRRARHRRLHGGGARRRANGRCRAPRTARSAPRSTPARCSRSWSRPGSRPASPTSSSSTR